jgi:hypothetical protein
MTKMATLGKFSHFDWIQFQLNLDKMWHYKFQNIQLWNNDVQHMLSTFKKTM